MYSGSQIDESELQSNLKYPTFNSSRVSHKFSFCGRKVILLTDTGIRIHNLGHGRGCQTQVPVRAKVSFKNFMNGMSSEAMKHTLHHSTVNICQSWITLAIFLFKLVINL